MKLPFGFEIRRTPKPSTPKQQPRKEPKYRRTYRRTVCLRGHALTVSNVVTFSNGSRRCRTCYVASYKRNNHEAKKRRERAAKKK